MSNRDRAAGPMSCFWVHSSFAIKEIVIRHLANPRRNTAYTNPFASVLPYRACGSSERRGGQGLAGPRRRPGCWMPGPCTISRLDTCADRSTSVSTGGSPRPPGMIADIGEKIGLVTDPGEEHSVATRLAPRRLRRCHRLPQRRPRRRVPLRVVNMVATAPRISVADPDRLLDGRSSAHGSSLCPPTRRSPCTAPAAGVALWPHRCCAPRDSARLESGGAATTSGPSFMRRPEQARAASTSERALR